MNLFAKKVFDIGEVSLLKNRETPSNYYCKILHTTKVLNKIASIFCQLQTGEKAC